MKRTNLPLINARYWVAILLASLLGTTFGDFVSLQLGLGYYRGLLPLGMVLAAIFIAEYRSKVPSEVYYWLAIIVTRTAATNLADLATHEERFNYYYVGLVLAAMLVFTLLIGRKATANHASYREELPVNNLRYWTAILIASTLGTTLGDFDETIVGLGVTTGSIMLLIVLCITLYTQYRLKLYNEATYWVTIVVVRTTGTSLGDFLSEDEGLNLGFITAASLVATVLVCVLYFWKSKRVQA